MKIVIKNLTQNIIQSIMMKINIMMIEIIDNHFITEMKKDHIKNSIIECFILNSTSLSRTD